MFVLDAGVRTVWRHPGARAIPHAAAAKITGVLDDHYANTGGTVRAKSWENHGRRNSATVPLYSRRQRFRVVHGRGERQGRSSSY